MCPNFISIIIINVPQGCATGRLLFGLPVNQPAGLRIRTEHILTAQLHAESCFLIVKGKTFLALRAKRTAASRPPYSEPDHSSAASAAPVYLLISNHLLQR